MNIKGNVVWSYAYQGEVGYFRGYAIYLTKDSGCVITDALLQVEGYVLKNR